jgi:hypothetical protein
MFSPLLILSRVLKEKTGQNLHDDPSHNDPFPGTETRQRDTIYMIPPMLILSRMLKERTQLNPDDPFGDASFLG